MTALFHKKNIILIIFLLIASVNFLKTTFQILNSRHRLEDIKNEVAVMEQKKDLLNEEIEYKKTQGYVEEEARNSLNMIKPGEEVYVVPGVSNEDFTAEKKGSTEVLGSETTVSGFKASNVYMWYRLFF